MSGRIIRVFLTAATFHSASAQTAPSLGTAQSFAVLGASTVTNTGPSVITGDLGVSPGTAVTGFPPGTVVGGSIHAADAVALQAQADNTTAYNDLAGEACNTTYGVPTDIGGLTLDSGVYCFSSSAGLTGTVTLDGQGNPNSVFVFKIASTLITASSSRVLLINGASACNVFWQVGSSATLGTSTNFVGNILALTSITLNTNAILSGRALAQNGAVTLDSNIVTVSTCGGITVVPPTLNKAFSPANIAAGGVSTLTITLSNTDGNAATLTAPLIDSLPTGVTISSQGSTTCGGTLAATTGSSTVTLTGGSIPADGSCTVTVNVTAPNAGTFINSLAAGALETSNGANAAPAVATLTANAPGNAPPTVNKSFSPAIVLAGGVSTLTLTLNNPAAVVADLTTPFTDTLPSGLDVSGNASTTCGGSLAAAAGSSSITLTGGSIPAGGSCTVTVDVIAAGAGNYFNSLPAGALQTGNGSNTTPAVATLTVNAAPVIAPTLGKAFSPGTVTSNGVSALTITLNNPDAVAANLIAPLTDQLPSGIQVSGNAITTCGGVLTAVAGGSSVVLTGGSIPAGGSCTVKVNVIGLCAAGTTSIVTAAKVSASAVGTSPVRPNWVSANQCTLINSISAGALQTSNGSNSAPANATLIVNATQANAPELLKNFVPGYIVAGANSTLTITLYNTAGQVTSPTAPLTDSFPSGMTVSSIASTTCKGTVQAIVGGTNVTLTGGSIPAYSTCTVTLGVTAPCTTSGQCTYINTLAAGALQTGFGTNSQPTSATLIVTPAPVVPPPTLLKTFSPSYIAKGKTSTLTITLRNPAGKASSLTASLTDSFPSGMTVSGSASNTCKGTVTASRGSSSVTLSGGSIPAYGSCTVTVAVTVPRMGTFINLLPAGALHTNQGNSTQGVSATLNVSN